MRIAFGVRLTLGLCFIACLSASAHAKPEFWEVYKIQYNLKEGSKLYAASCKNCHTSPPARNPYGKAVEAALDAAHQRKLTPDILVSIGGQDSDGDGVSNANEINAGTLPGDPKDKPANTGAGSGTAGVGGTGGPGGSAQAAIETPEIHEEPLIPPHTFHPLLVHFPIALFLFGAFLEVLGKKKSDPGMRDFAFWNLGFGALFGVLAALTGLIALLRLELPFEGTQLYHLIVAGAAAILMSIVALWRRKQKPDSAFYWAVLVVTCAAIMVGGHLGSMLVYS